MEVMTRLRLRVSADLACCCNAWLFAAANDAHPLAKDWQKKQVIDRKVSGGDERDLIDWNCQGRDPMTSPPTGRDLLGLVGEFG